LIKLTKGAEPQRLLDNAAQWTTELIAEIQNGGDKISYRKSKYNHPDIKEAIKAETHKKCAYCESKPLHVTHGDIEHVVPKASNPQMTFNWNNLTLACDRCNTKKADHEGLLDPYNCEPSDELRFYGPMVLHREGRAAAEITRTRLDLNRTDLLDKRRERLDNLTDKLRRIAQHPEVQERELLMKVAIESETSDDAEFAACVRDYLSGMN
jgi:5-methylcytosine-specific restriction endonuclease McrA